MPRPPHVFAGNPLDRSSNLRRDPDWLQARLGDARARFLPYGELQVLVRHASPTVLAWQGPELLERDEAAAGAVLLGLRDGVPYFAMDVGDLDADAAGALASDTQAQAFREVREVAPELPVEDAGIIAQGRSLLDWHARHPFCARCGDSTAAALGGAMRRCDACSAEHFPRVDPVVIMLAVDGDDCLLGHGRGRPGSNYTCLAGFMEPGETIEEAVAREVVEESGVPVVEVRYHSSQPWPFPASLMIGCHATVGSRSLDVDPVELADARWFPREQVALAVAAAADGSGQHPELDFGVPAPFTISHQLIAAWVRGEA